MSQPAKWWPDPYGRFEQRYFDGESWTAHVISGGEQTVDPLGTTVSVPFTAPTSDPISAPAGSEAAGGVAIHQFLDGLGPEARTRSAVHLSIVLAGVGGVVAAAGVGVAILGDSDSSRPRTSPWPSSSLHWHTQSDSASSRRPKPIGRGRRRGHRHPRTCRGHHQHGDGGGTAVLAAVFFIAAWAAPGMRGRPLLLGEGAVSFVLALTTLDSTSTTDNRGYSTSAPPM